MLNREKHLNFWQMLLQVGAILLITFSVKGRPLLTSAKFIEYLEAWPFLLYLGVQTVILVVLLYLK